MKAFGSWKRWRRRIIGGKPLQILAITFSSAHPTGLPLETRLERPSRWGANPIVYSRLATALIASDAPRDQVSAIAVEMTGRFPEDAQAWTLAGLIYVDLNQEAEAEAAYRSRPRRASSYLPGPPGPKEVCGNWQSLNEQYAFPSPTTTYSSARRRPTKTSCYSPAFSSDKCLRKCCSNSVRRTTVSPELWRDNSDALREEIVITSSRLR